MKSAPSREIESLSRVSRHCQANPASRILLVDDDPDIGQFNSKALLKHGYEVDVAEDGETGWTELQNNRYNLLITKNDLPKLTGVGLLKKLRSACMPLPVIMVIETVPTWESPQYSWLLNANKLLMPYSFEELLGMVKRILQVTANIPVLMTSAPNWQAEISTVSLQL
jgi:DNA-binding response OmpR family regulator